MKGNFHARFLGGRGRVNPPAPTRRRATMLTHSHRLVLIALAGAVLCIAGAVFALKTPVRVYDKRFRVAGFGVSLADTNSQVMYFRGRFLGRVQERLAKLGLGIKPPLGAGYTIGIGGAPCTFIAVAYSGELTERELGSVRAWLVNGDGKVFTLDSMGGLNISGIHRDKPYYFGAWYKDLNKPHRIATNNSTWILRLQSEEGARLAEITFQNPQE